MFRERAPLRSVKNEEKPTVESSDVEKDFFDRGQEAKAPEAVGTTDAENVFFANTPDTAVREAELSALMKRRTAQQEAEINALHDQIDNGTAANNEDEDTQQAA